MERRTEYTPKEIRKIETALSRIKPDFNKLTDTNNCVQVLSAIAVDYETERNVMEGSMDLDAFTETILTGYAVFWSKTRNELWLKGETSGNRLVMKWIDPDCDNDNLLLYIKPLGPVCHTGTETCYDQSRRYYFDNDDKV